MKHAPLPLILISAALLVSSRALAAAPPAEPPLRLSLYGLVEHFEWKEFGDDGSQLLKESGPMFGIGGVADFDTRHVLHLEALGEFFGGRVSYDGATQENIPVDSHTTYVGGKAEGSLLVPLKVASRVTLTPAAGVGGSSWRRELEDSGDAVGYVENWYSLYGILGARAAVRVGKSAELFGKAAVNMPFYNEVRYDFSNFGGPSNVQVEPGKNAGPYVEVGVAVGDFFLAGFYEELKFSKSNTTDIGPDVTVWQPESKVKIYGVHAGMRF